MLRRLPVPDSRGIYGFPDALLTRLEEWQGHLRSRGSDQATTVLELTAPLNGARYLIEKRMPRGRPVLALEPHHDDLILSAGGHFLREPRPLTVVTVFTRSSSVHPEIRARYAGVNEISALRAEESRQAFRPLGATHHLLGLADADAPYESPDPASVEVLAGLLRPYIEENPKAELIAPAGVTRHPDHLRVHEAARLLGCRWFWDDTSFYPTYAANVDDRLLFELRTCGALTGEVRDVTQVVLHKLILLHMYQSQMQPLREMYRVLRYNWTVAAVLDVGRRVAPNARFGERFFRARPVGPV